MTNLCTGRLNKLAQTAPRYSFNVLIMFSVSMNRPTFNSIITLIVSLN